MVSTTFSLIAFFAPIARRFAFTGLWHRPLAREIAAPQQQHNNVLEQRLHILDLARVAAIPDYRFDDGSDGVNPIAPKDRANTYLLPIDALTGVERVGRDSYWRRAGRKNFLVDSSFVRVVSHEGNAA